MYVNLVNDLFCREIKIQIPTLLLFCAKKKMDLSFQFLALQTTRENIRKTLQEFSINQLNKIPEGYNNNLIWHYGHVIVTQQLLCYKLSNTPMYVGENMVHLYRKGSAPSEFVSEEDYHVLQKLDDKLCQQIKADYANQIFGDYKPYTTSYNITLNNVEDAITFNNVHEGLHLGNMMSMRRLV